MLAPDPSLGVLVAYAYARALHHTVHVLFFFIDYAVYLN